MFDTMKCMTMTADLKDQALRVAGRIDPDVMTGPQAAAAVEDLAMVEKATAGTLLFVALRVAKTNAWQGHGFKPPQIGWHRRWGSRCTKPTGNSAPPAKPTIWRRPRRP
jgi:hypothetical protein